MLVLVGVRSTAVSECVVVVEAAGSLTTVVQEHRAATAIIGIAKISFFISGFDANKPDSRQIACADGFEGDFFCARATAASRPVPADCAVCSARTRTIGPAELVRQVASPGCFNFTMASFAKAD